MCNNTRTSKWDDAYNNTITTSSYNKYLGVESYTKTCKNCGSKHYKNATQDGQLIGNCYQRIVVCECNHTFIEEWKQ